jgi:hypothetical protein
MQILSTKLAKADLESVGKPSNEGHEHSTKKNKKAKL